MGDELMEWLVWPVLLLIILVFELKALLSKTRGDTLSESIWWLRTRVWGRIIIVPLWAWMTWHFFLEPPSISPGAGVWIDDIFIVALALGAALLLDYNDLDGNRPA